MSGTLDLSAVTLRKELFLTNSASCWLPVSLRDLMSLRPGQYQLLWKPVIKMTILTTLWVLTYIKYRDNIHYMII